MQRSASISQLNHQNKTATCGSTCISQPITVVSQMIKMKCQLKL